MMSANRFFLRELRGLFDFLLPPACALCLTPLVPPDPNTFCSACNADLPKLAAAHCPLCALPYPTDADLGHHCQNCLQHGTALFSGVTPLGPFEGILREAIHRFKYRGDINLDRPLGHLLADKLRQAGQAQGLIVPVPLHAAKLRQRTYNQAGLIASRLAKALDLSVTEDLLVRRQEGATQKEISARDREQNVKRLFTCTRPVGGKHILLVDDVMTTGATARACSRTLLANGAASVHIAVLARAPLR